MSRWLQIVFILVSERMLTVSCIRASPINIGTDLIDYLKPSVCQNSNTFCSFVPLQCELDVVHQSSGHSLQACFLRHLRTVKLFITSLTLGMNSQPCESLKGHCFEAWKMWTLKLKNVDWSADYSWSPSAEAQWWNSALMLVRCMRRWNWGMSHNLNKTCLCIYINFKPVWQLLQSDCWSKCTVVWNTCFQVHMDIALYSFW